MRQHFIVIDVELASILNFSKDSAETQTHFQEFRCLECMFPREFFGENFLIG